MRIDQSSIQRTVVEYDFNFSSSHFLSMTIDPKFDTIEFGEHEIKAVLGGRERNGSVSPTEEITIYKSHLITSTKRERVVTELSTEEAENLKLLVKGSEKTIH